MRIDVYSIPPNGIILEEDCSQDALDISKEDIKFVGCLHIRAFVSKAINLIIIKLFIKSKFLASCSYCLKEVQEDYEREFELNLPVDRNTKLIDISKDIREEILLSYPLKPLCKEDCLGLCPKCGQNLNEKKCSCK